MSSVSQNKCENEKYSNQKDPSNISHYNISSTRYMPSSYLVQPVRPPRRNNCGQWNNEKAVCSYTRLSSLDHPRAELVCFVPPPVAVMRPNNKSKIEFLFESKSRQEYRGAERMKRKKQLKVRRRKYLLEWLIKLDVDKYCVCHGVGGHPWRCRLAKRINFKFFSSPDILSYTPPERWSLAHHPLNVRRPTHQRDHLITISLYY